MIVEVVDQLEDLAGRVGIKVDRLAGDSVELGHLGFDFGSLQGLLHRSKVFGIAEDLELIADRFDIVGSVLHCQLQQAFFVGLLAVDDDHPFAFEHPSNAAGRAELAASDFKNLLHFGCGAIAIVGEDFAQDGNAIRAIAFVQDFVEVTAFELAGAFFDGPFDVVFGHADRFGVVDRVAQSQVGIRVAAARFGSYDDRARELAPDLAAFVINQGFFVLDARPVRMSSQFFK